MADTITGQLDPFRSMSGLRRIRLARPLRPGDARAPLLLRPGERPETGEPRRRRLVGRDGSDTALERREGDPGADRRLIQKVAAFGCRRHAG